MTPAQLTSLKNDIAANANTVAWQGTPTAISALPNSADANFAIAAWYNQNAAPDFTVWNSATPIDAIQDATLYANMTPAQAIPDTPQLAVTLWTAKALAAQGKQFNLQNLMLGKTTINAAKPGVRNAFQDCLTALPTKNDGTNQAAGWTAVQTAMQRLARNVEKLFSTAAAPSNLAVFEGTISGDDVELARNS
jgi:hypothetical protein